jgi:Hypervirulence associated proteins TUDOR domain
MTDSKDFKQGDDVTWSSHGNTVHGKVVEKLTSDTDSKAAGRRVKASKDDPQYLVKSDKSGGEAAHKPDALERD